MMFNGTEEPEVQINNQFDPLHIPYQVKDEPLDVDENTASGIVANIPVIPIPADLEIKSEEEDSVECQHVVVEETQQDEPENEGSLHSVLEIKDESLETSEKAVQPSSKNEKVGTIVKRNGKNVLKTKHKSLGSSFTTEPAKKARKSLTIEKKIKIIKEVEKNKKSKTQFAKYFNISKSTLSTILKNKSNILLQASKSTKKSYMSNGRFEKLEEKLFEYFNVCRHKKIPVNGKVLRSKASDLALIMGITNFQCSTGWFHKFKNRYDISYPKVGSEEESVNDASTEDWHIIHGPILDKYKARNIYTMSETGLFFKALPDSTLALKGEKCHKGERSQIRVTVALACNKDGSEKLKPIVIGKNRKPRCFRNLKDISQLPVKYNYNKKAWMNVDVFHSFVVNLEQKAACEKRKILLLLDNAPVHKIEGLDLKHIEVIFLPPNSTSKSQPMNKGIIQNFKVHYRRSLVQHYLRNIENANDISDVPPWTLSHAARAIAQAWRDVTPETISNCWHLAGFPSSENDEMMECQQQPNYTTPLPPSTVATLLQQEVLKLQEHLPTCSGLNVDVALQYADFDDNLATDDEAIVMSNNEVDAEQTVDVDLVPSSCDDSDSECLTPAPTRSEILKALQTLHNFQFHNSFVPLDFNDHLNFIESSVIDALNSAMKQTSITDSPNK